MNRLAVLRWSVFLVSALIVLIIDQSAKFWVEASLQLGETWQVIPAISDFLAVTRSYNTGAALGIIPQGGTFFLIAALIMIVGIIIYYPRLQGLQWYERFALGLLLGGAAGNAIDRLRLGYVIDFVHVQLKPYISNVSNFADHAIVIGIIILFIAQWRKPQPAPNEAQRMG